MSSALPRATVPSGSIRRTSRHAIAGASACASAPPSGPPPMIAMKAPCGVDYSSSHESASQHLAGSRAGDRRLARESARPSRGARGRRCGGRHGREPLRAAAAAAVHASGMSSADVRNADDAAARGRRSGRRVRRARHPRQQRRRRHFANVADMTLEQWHEVIDTNLSGVFYCCHAAHPAPAPARRRLDHQHQQPRRQERVRRRRRVLRLEGRAERVQRSADAGSPARQHPRQLHDAGLGGDRIRRRAASRAADWKLRRKTSRKSSSI